MASHDQHPPTPTPAAPAALPVIALILPVLAAGSAWLIPHHGSAVTVAGVLGWVVLCGAAAVTVTGWHRRAVDGAVHAAVHTAVRVAVQAAVLDAARDPLTGLPTRVALDRALDVADRAAAPFTIVLLDVDGLHDINSRWGHAAGDQYLAAIAGRLATTVPEHGLLVRHGGDELTVVLAGDDAAGMQARISAALAAPGIVAGQEVPLRASVGIAVGGPASTTRSTTGTGAGAAVDAAADGAVAAARYVLACADTAMYTAKHRGGGRVLLYRADRDGRPALDGTRPLLRRRDSRPDRPDRPDHRRRPDRPGRQATAAGGPAATTAGTSGSTR